MKYKVSELEGALLDAAVAKIRANDCAWDARSGPPPYSTSWLIAGPIIERERITLVVSKVDGVLEWSSWIGEFSYYIDESLPAYPYNGLTVGVGNTPLVAAMRVYVTSKFGEEVELEVGAE